jgi:hypothetical protein
LQFPEQRTFAAVATVVDESCAQQFRFIDYEDILWAVT